MLHFQDYTYRPFFGDSAVISVGFLTVGYFIASIFGGLVIPFLLLRISEHYRINPHGLFAMLLIVLLFRIAFFYIWNINWIYFVVTIVICYIGGIFLNFYLAPVDPLPSPLQRRRVLLSWYITCIFLVGGFGLHFKDGGIVLGYFIASIAGGLAIPHLLYRGSN